MGSATNKNQRRSLDGEAPVAQMIDSVLHGKKLRPEERQAVERICAQWASLDDILDAAAGPREPIGEQGSAFRVDCKIQHAVARIAEEMRTFSRLKLILREPFTDSAFARFRAIANPPASFRRR